MATIVLGIVGGAIGSAFGPVGAKIGWALGTTLGSMVDASMMPGNNVKVGQMSDLRVSGSSYGTSIPYIWGNNRPQGATIIWSTDLQEHETTQSQGGKGGGGASTTTYTYTASVAVQYCHGAIMYKDGTIVNRHPVVKRIWADDQIVWDSSIEATPPPTIPAWDSTVTYSSGDYVTYGGNTWKAIAPITGNAPGISHSWSWMLSAPPTTGSSTANVIHPVFYGGTETQLIDSTIASAIPNTPAYRGTCYFVITDMDLTDFSNRIPNFSVELDTDVCHVSDFLEDICGLVGLTSEDYDFSQASTTVIDGYYVDDQTTAQDAINPLVQWYGFDLAEIDGKLVAVKRGGDAVLTIDEEDMGAAIEDHAATGQDDFTRFEMRRAQDVELPAVLQVAYYTKDKFLEQGLQSDTRQYADTYNITQLSTKFALHDTDARRGAGRLLDTAWIERTTYNFPVLPKYVKLACSDPILVPVDGRLHRARITDLTLGMFGEIQIGCVEDDTAALTQTVTGAGTGDTSGSGSLQVIPADFVAWSGTELRDIDQEQAGFYVGAQGTGGNTKWRGGRVYYLLSGSGASWTPVNTISTAAIFGASSTALADSPVLMGVKDTVNSVTVHTVDGSLLASTSDADVLSGANVAILGDEVIGFTTATLVSAGVYTLSGIYRGLRGSPMTGHTTTDQFLLASSALQRIQLPDSAIGTDVGVRVVSSYQQLTDVTPVYVTIAPKTPSALASALGALNIATPYRIRLRDGVKAGAGTSDIPDSTWFDLGDPTSYQTTEIATFSGSMEYVAYPAAFTMWGRLKFQNNGTGSVTITVKIMNADDAVQAIWEGITICSAYSNGSDTGTFTIAAGDLGLFEFFFQNHDDTDAGNPGRLHLQVSGLTSDIKLIDAGL